MTLSTAEDPPPVLDIDELIHLAARQAGSDDFGAPSWRPGLEALIASANDEARLTALGRATMTVQVSRSLANRVGVHQWHEDHPDTGTRPIEQPVFILGLPRCGTTLLSYLLDRDPANRSLLRSECLTSTPPPETATLRTDRRVHVAQAEMDALYEILPAFKAIHYEEGAGPTECITVLGQEMRSVHYETMAHLPSYSEWHRACDMVPAYEWHRRVLQVLQWRAPGRWVLKSPCHNLSLDALDTVYPDARFVVPHRDPEVAVTSMANLVSVLAGLGTEADWDDYIGRHWLELSGQMLDGLLAFRDHHGDERFLDIAFDDLVGDTPGTVRHLYDWLGWPLTDEAERAIDAYLAEATRDRFGRHTYDADRFGLTSAAIRDRVEGYTDRFAAYL